MERIKLIAPDGMVFDNGGKVIYLPVGQQQTNRRLLPRQEYEDALRDGVLPGEATDADFLAALGEFGVIV